MRGPHLRPLALLGLLGLLCAAPRAVRAQQCRLCENGTYCFLETLFVCPLNSRSLPGSGNVTDCVCIAGHYATEDHSCLPCEPGSFCPGDESLQPCPSNGFAVDLSDCFCSQGYTGLLGPPRACTLEYSGSTPSTVIWDWSTVQRKQHTDFINVQDNKYWVMSLRFRPKQSNWQNIVGLGRVGTLERGWGLWLKTQSTSLHWCFESCPWNADLNSIPVTFNKWQTLLIVREDTLLTFTLRQEESGVQATTTRPWSQTPSDLRDLTYGVAWPNGPTENFIGDLNVFKIALLTAGPLRYSHALTDWHGFATCSNPTFQECSACTSGSAKAGNGSAACVLCASGKFQDASGGGACNKCPAHSNTPGVTGSQAVTACVSDPGYFFDPANGMLTPCVPGTFQPLANQSACVDCRRGDAENRFYTVDNASSSELLCVACPDDSQVLGPVSGHGILSCACSAGSTGSNGGPCAACAAGSVKAGAGSASCVECVEDEYAHPTNTICIACTGNSTSLEASDNRSACVCDAGFALNPYAPFDCQECAAGERAVDPGGLAECEACPAGEYNNLRRQTACTPCPANETI